MMHHFSVIFQIQLLKDVFKDVELNIQPGLMRIKWSSLGICDYAENCITQIKNLNTLFTQIKHVEKHLHKRLHSIATMILFEDYHFKRSGGSFTCKDFFICLNLVRTERSSKVLKVYESFGPILIKMEASILNTSTGSSPHMTVYYTYWEAEIFKALVTFLLKNLELCSQRYEKKEVLFQVDAVVVTPEILLRPTANDIYNMVIRSTKDLVERLKLFPRWMDGSCIECKPVKMSDNEDHLHSFHEEVLKVPDINEAVSKIYENAHKVICNVNKELNRWKKYRNLWSFDKAVTCEKFLEKYSSLSLWDDKFMFYNQIIESLESISSVRDIGCIQLNLKPLLNTIVSHCMEWKTTLGSLIDSITKEKMDEMSSTIKDLKMLVSQNIKGMYLQGWPKV